MSCKGTNARGEPCAAPERLVGADGWCPAHGPNRERMREAQRQGGSATAMKLRGGGFEPEEVVKLETLEDAKLALDQVRRAVLCRQITHSEGSAATKAVDSWVKTEAAIATQRIVNELQRELDAKAREIAELRSELAKAKVRAV